MAKKNLTVALHTTIIEWATNEAARLNVSRNEFVEKQLSKTLDKKAAFIDAISSYISAQTENVDSSIEKSMALQLRPEAVSTTEKWANMFKVHPKFIIMVALTAAKYSFDNITSL